MKVLLLGGSSFVGSSVRRHATWPAGGTWTYCSTPQYDARAVRLDLLDADQVHLVIERYAPTHVLDTSVVGREEAELASNAAENICAALRAQRHATRYLFVSTDAVFSGTTNRPYVETDPVNPGSDYGKTKAMVERILLSSLSNCCVARTCIVYGRDWRGMRPQLGPRVANILEGLRCKRPVIRFGDQYRTPTYIDDLAPMLLRLLTSSFRGVLHLTGLERCSRLDFAREVARAFGFNPQLVVDQPLPENLLFGRDTSLDSTSAVRLEGWAPRGLRTALSELAAWVDETQGHMI
jgi:dTDP-4-dehydrorhamnose reductase